MRTHKHSIIKLPDASAVAEYAANKFIKISSDAEKDKAIKHISLSGGNTPAILFKMLASDNYKDQINWRNIHLWWGDERAVSPDNPESNFGNAKKLLLLKISIPPDNIHRIQGELKPENAAEKYSLEIIDHIPFINGLPALDWTILGMGDDGHTASLFMIDNNFYTENLTDVTAHPQSGQERITLTQKMLCASKQITFLVTGKNKAAKTEEILGVKTQANEYTS